MTDALRESGGHIAYAIRPCERGKGYGKILLKEILLQARLMGLKSVLITAQIQNAASIAVAKANGGIICRQNDERVYINIDI